MAVALSERAAGGGVNSEPWLTKTELARKLRVSAKSIQRHYRPTMVVGGQNRYLMSHVEAQAHGHDDALPDNVIALRRRRRDRAA